MQSRPGVSPLEWRLAEMLALHPGLALMPSRSADVVIEGDLYFRRAGPGGVVIADTYTLSIEVPRTFPRALPRVVETRGKVPRDFHRNPDNSLCLGSPIAQRFEIEFDPSIGTFVDRVVVPYLYSHAYFVRFGSMPFGELKHGTPGLESDVRRLFHLPQGTDAGEFLRLASLKRRHANKRPCPCRSGRRVGRCHRAVVHEARRRLGRFTCREQYTQLVPQRRKWSVAEAPLQRPGRR